MSKFRRASHSVHSMRVHLVWITKYRYKVLKGEVGYRLRELLRQDCARMDIQIIKGVVSKDHIYLYISYPPKLSVSEIVKKLKGRSSKKIQQEFTELRKRYWGRHLWGIGYGALSSGNITDETIQNYIDNHDESNKFENDFKIK